jgi:hypothetical protein
MIVTPKSILATMASAVLTRIFRNVCPKRIEMSVEDVKAREEAAAFATVGSVLHLLGMTEEAGLRR